MGAGCQADSESTTQCFCGSFSEQHFVINWKARSEIVCHAYIFPTMQISAVFQFMKSRFSHYCNEEMHSLIEDRHLTVCRT